MGGADEVLEYEQVGASGKEGVGQGVLKRTAQERYSLEFGDGGIVKLRLECLGINRDLVGGAVARDVDVLLNLEVEAPVRAIGEIRPPKLIKEVSPVYPEIARQARVEGVVIVEATTDIYGRVQNIKILRSIPLLDQSAIDAVRQWVYEPMIINGRPRGVIFTVTVRFQLK